MIQVGDSVPDFIVPATSHKNVQLRALQGHKILLYFYPKDHTPACTIENQDFAANYQRFRRQNTLVFGVSRDSLEDHESFKEAQALPFELISDEDGRLCELFGVLREKLLFGKPITSLCRSSFLLDERGHLIREWRNVEVRNHVHDVIDILESGEAADSQKTG
ncbi:peroxiredoxin [Reinekea blandensis]|uniref:thioredoxin-dependent peroxiredoxin n=1 Tax=Reinekea blandensis MED297 TaxID=314283 RepID=A4BHX4_9GAMM|nr:peroxiredoxin [Reinekea blandensis]EAR08246.1 Alkyl hydroperoxide reductase/ Thiol specific antioxidant [Reinekea sp. MED297] [Reinekea blandensis MED297]